MDKRIGQIVAECVFDLGITVIYAAIAGLMIVAVVASDDGPISIFTACLYASLLPGAVVILIGIDLVVRVLDERRAARPTKAPRDQLEGLRPRQLEMKRKTCFSDG